MKDINHLKDSSVVLRTAILREYIELPLFFITDIAIIIVSSTTAIIIIFFLNYIWY